MNPTSSELESLYADAIATLKGLLSRMGEFPEHHEVGRTGGQPSDPARFVSLPFRVTHVAGRNKSWWIRAVVKSEIHPKQARLAIWELQQSAPEVGKIPVYSVLIAPYISPAVAQLCEDEEIGHLDLSGNCRLFFGGIWIELRGKDRKLRERKELRSFFSPKTARLLRTLLQGRLTAHKVLDLAEAAGTSTGLTSKLRQRLLEQEWAVNEEGGIRITRPHQLLDAWVEDDDWAKRTEVREYSLLETDPLKIATALKDALEKQKVSHAFTQWFAAWLRAPYTIPPVVSAYVERFPDDEMLWELLKARRVDPGAGRLRLIGSRDFRGVTTPAQVVKGFTAVSDVQIYLDLLGAGQRADEQAKELRNAKDFSGGWE